MKLPKFSFTKKYDQKHVVSIAFSIIFSLVIGFYIGRYYEIKYARRVYRNFGDNQARQFNFNESNPQNRVPRNNNNFRQ